MTPPHLSLSAEDRGRVEEIQKLVQGGAASIDALVRLLADKSWAVRRAATTSLARIGEPVAAPLCALLETDRSDEGQLAAAVDVLSQALGNVDGAVIALAERATHPAVVCDAIQILGRRNSTRSISLLAKLTAHADDNIAVAAIEALGRIGGASAIDPLVAAARTRNFFRTFPSIDVLGSSGDPRVIAPLTELLDDPMYAAEATRALGRTAQLAAMAPLARLVAKPGPFVVPAMRALAELGSRYAARFGDLASFVAAYREHVDALSVTDNLLGANIEATEDRVAFATVLSWVNDSRVVAKLVALLDSPAPLSTTAYESLRNIGSAAEPEVLSALAHGDSAHRARLIPLVGAKKTSVPALRECLRDDDPSVRALACDALARIGDASVVPDLFAHIGDSDARVTQAASAAIQSLGSSETESLALKAASSKDDRVRRTAIRIISYFGYPKALSVLLDATKDSNERIRDAATQGLAFIDDPRALDALSRLAQDASPQTRAFAVRALGQTSPLPTVIAHIRARLTDADSWVRYYACQALGRLGARDCIVDVARLMEDPAGQVRVAAVESTARLGGEHAHAALEHATHSDDADVRRAALTGLGLMNRAEAAPVLVRALASEDAATRLIALSALASLEAPSFASTIFEALALAVDDVDADVRSAAMTLVEQHRSPAATRWLIEQLREGSRREWAIRALTIPHDDRLERILSSLESADAVMAPLLVNVLTRMHRADGSAAVVSLLGADNVFARRAAASALVASALPEARDALASAQKHDEDEEVRKIASTAFAG